MTPGDLLLSAPLCCARCEHPLEATCVDLATGLATCRPCDRVFTIDGDTAIREERRVIPDTIEPIAAPDRLRPADGTAPEMAWRRRAPRALGLMYLCAGGGTTTIFGGCVALALCLPSGRAALPIGLVFAPFVLIGLLLIYAGISSLLSSTTIAVDATAISVRRTFSLSPKVSTLRNVALAADPHTHALSGWSVRIIGRDRRAIHLLGGLGQDEARYLAEEINQALARR